REPPCTGAVVQGQPRCHEANEFNGLDHENQVSATHRHFWRRAHDSWGNDPPPAKDGQSHGPPKPSTLGRSLPSRMGSQTDPDRPCRTVASGARKETAAPLYAGMDCHVRSVAQVRFRG